MRYDDWDVLLFPAGTDSKVPLKEFKVACHVIPEIELSHIHGAVGFPVMTCFVPSLQPGAPFSISIHSWDTPKISRFTQLYSRHSELAKLEARVFVDGRIVASRIFGRKNNWPLQIETTFEVNKHGELEGLRFPHFREELLYQNHWNPGDDIGRIKIIISEGFPRDSLSVPLERVKNIIAFSFQHAPLDILENNGIAWPNPYMWRRAVPNLPMAAPTGRSNDGSEAHAHTPRRRAGTFGSRQLQTSSMSAMAPPQMPSAFGGPFQMADGPRGDGPSSSQNQADPFCDSTACFDWLSSANIETGERPFLSRHLRGPSKQLSSDTTMSDYMTVPIVPDAMVLSGGSMEDDPIRLKVPTNTPTAGDESQSHQFSMALQNSTIPLNLATSLTHSLLNQPLPIPILPQCAFVPPSEVKSRKENKHLASVASLASSASSTPDVERAVGKASAPTFAASHLGRMSSRTGRARSGSTTPSSGSQPVFSAGATRTPSEDGFGINITNINPNTSSLAMESANRNFNTSDQTDQMCALGFSPATAKAMDSGGESRKASPLVEVTTHGQPESERES